MPLNDDDLRSIPLIQQLLSDVAELKRENAELRARQLKWVTDAQAQQITGLSRRSLLRERQKPDTLIVHKEDHGVRYDSDSLLKHNTSRAVGRSRLRQYLSVTN